MKRSRKVSYQALLAIGLVMLAGCPRGCTGCTGTESCDNCVARCVQTQGVSPDLCRTTACASVCKK